MTSTKTYGYSNSAWGDLLTSFEGHTITYDAIGNPLAYHDGSTFTWTGRQLTGATKSGNTYSFTYNDEGVRTSKTKNGVTTKYYLNGSQIIGEETNGEQIFYVYDYNGNIVGMTFNYDDNYSYDSYWFRRNLQGDIVEVYNDSGSKVISYKYDAYGNFTATYHNGMTASTAPKIPFLYRGYYYDYDLGLYYLNSRYYDSNTGRFINADGYVSTGQGIIGNNMFAYCNNNPINCIDYSGEFPWPVVIFLACAAIIGGTLGYNSDKKLGLISNSSNGGVGSDENITDNDENELSTGDRIKNTVIGAGMGLFTGGVCLIGYGAFFTLSKGLTAVCIFNMTGPQVVASGIIVHNFMALLSPFVGIQEIEPIEYGNAYQPYIPNNTGRK